MKFLCQAHTVEQRAWIQVIASALEEADIPCLIRNENLAVAMGDIPYTECFPELWVFNDTDHPKAGEIVANWRASQAAVGESWVCPDCGEAIEGQFAACWKCGWEQP